MLKSKKSKMAAINMYFGWNKETHFTKVLLEKIKHVKIFLIDIDRLCKITKFTRKICTQSP